MEYLVLGLFHLIHMLMIGFFISQAINMFKGKRYFIFGLDVAIVLSNIFQLAEIIFES